jgi:hypothetical protein
MAERMKSPAPVRIHSAWIVLLLSSALHLPAATVPSEVQAEIAALKQRLQQLEALVVASMETDSAVAGESAYRPIATFTPPAPPPSQTPLPEPLVAVPAFEFYGYLKIDTFAESMDTFTDAIPFWVCRVDADGANTDSEFGLTAKESRFGVVLNPVSVGGGNLGGRFEFDFYGNTGISGHHAYTPRSRHAFVEWTGEDWSFLAGETWEPYIITFPRTVNFTAYNMQGQLGLRHTQVRATHRLRLDGERNITSQFALTEPLAGVHGADLNGDGQDDAAESGIPSVAYKFEYQAQRLKLAISGFYGRENYDATSSYAAQQHDAWAVIVGGEVPLTRHITLRGTTWTGTNLDGAWGGVGQGVNPQLGRSIDAYGGWVQIGARLWSGLSCNVGYSLDNPADRDLGPGQRTFNESYLLNGFYTVTEDLTFGLELLHLRTGYKTDNTAEANRVQGSVKYQF